MATKDQSVLPQASGSNALHQAMGKFPVEIQKDHIELFIYSTYFFFKSGSPSVQYNATARTTTVNMNSYQN